MSLTDQPAGPSEPATLAVTVQKGGTGKTTTAINVGGALNQRGRDVLLVDLDPQGAATEGLGFNEVYDAQPPSLADVLTEPKEHREHVPDLVVGHPEMDVLPSNIEMTAVEPDLTLMRRGGVQLNLALEELLEHRSYDYIIIDTPPFLGYITDNALYAAQNLLVPVLAESTSKRALELLYDHVDSTEYDYEVTIQERAVVANRVEETNEAEHMLEWFRAAFDDVPVWEVRKRVALQRAFNNGVSIFEHDEACDMAARYLEIAANLDQQFGFPEPESDQEVTA